MEKTILGRRVLPIVCGAGLILSLSFGSLAQTSDEKKDQLEAQRATKEAAYYAPIRYVIVYNDIFDLNPEERRISILMFPNQFNRQNLIKVFELIKKRFPIPVRLDINVHTSLATIETPEESEMTDDSLNTRFRKQENKYKIALFLRNEEGENFCYTTSLKPYSNRWACPLESGTPSSPC